VDYILNNNPPFIGKSHMDELLLQYTLVNKEEMDVLGDEGDARAVAATLVAGVEQAP
jgi:hypothetical protein